MYVIICNERAGSGKAAAVKRTVEQLLKNEEVDFFSFTSDSALSCQKFMQGMDRITDIIGIIIIGGDGTFHTVIQSAAAHGLPCAFLPVGSGNDIARAFDLSYDPVTFVKSILKRDIRQIDLLTVNGMYGLSVAGVGADAHITEQADRSFYKPFMNRVGIGSKAYVIAAITGLLTFKPFGCRILTDGRHIDSPRTWLIACGNTRWYGGGLPICPQADPADGMISCTMLMQAGRLRVLARLFPKLVKGKEIAEKEVTYITGKDIRIEAERVLPYVVDGEVYHSRIIHIGIETGRLSLILT